MPRFKFGLQRVLDIRATQERIKQNELALEIKKEHEIRMKIDRILQSQSEAYAVTRVLFSSAQGDSRLYLAHQRYLEALEESITSAYQDLEAQRQAVEAARLALIEASRKRKLLEKLKDKRGTAFKKEEEVAEQKNIDEIGGTSSARQMAQNPGMEA